MSYKHAWDLIAELNDLFGQPVVAARPGGRKGGGAGLTPLGQAVVERYRAVESAATNLAREHIAALEAEIRSV